MRLIDADAMEQRFCYGVNAESFDWVYDTHDLPAILMEMPTVDAVPVVRCADCKYLNEDLAVGEWDGSCRYCNTHSVLYSWFCSQGERRDGDGNG